MSHYEMHAYLDPKAEPIFKQCVQTSGCVPKYMPDLAERAGLGEHLNAPVYGNNYFENGVIIVKRVTEKECS